jgi:hypothetical protein
MKRILGLVAIIGLTLTVVTGCATSEDSSSTVAPEAEAPEAGSVAADCATTWFEMEKDLSADGPGQIDYATSLKTFARTWPQMNDPDLKSIFREWANNGFEGEASDNPYWVAARTICASYW